MGYSYLDKKLLWNFINAEHDNLIKELRDNPQNVGNVGQFVEFIFAYAYRVCKNNFDLMNLIANKYKSERFWVDQWRIFSGELEKLPPPPPPPPSAGGILAEKTDANIQRAMEELDLSEVDAKLALNPAASSLTGILKVGGFLFYHETHQSQNAGVKNKKTGIRVQTYFYVKSGSAVYLVAVGEHIPGKSGNTAYRIKKCLPGYKAAVSETGTLKFS